MDDKHIYKNHNKTMLLYHLVFPAKYRRKVFTEEVGERLKEICMENNRPLQNIYTNGVKYVEIYKYNRSLKYYKNKFNKFIYP
ncbi:transposase [Treponema sp.]|uniref:transposase n=1 Tax=Treponema sp. TaxID=166 RepID=UPI003EFE63EE